MLVSFSYVKILVKYKNVLKVFYNLYDLYCEKMDFFFLILHFEIMYGTHLFCQVGFSDANLLMINRRMIHWFPFKIA